MVKARHGAQTLSLAEVLGRGTSIPGPGDNAAGVSLPGDAGCEVGDGSVRRLAHTACRHPHMADDIDPTRRPSKAGLAACALDLSLPRTPLPLSAPVVPSAWTVWA